MILRISQISHEYFFHRAVPRIWRPVRAAPHRYVSDSCARIPPFYAVQQYPAPYFLSREKENAECYPLGIPYFQKGDNGHGRDREIYRGSSDNFTFQSVHDSPGFPSGRAHARFPLITLFASMYHLKAPEKYAGEGYQLWNI